MKIDVYLNGERVLPPHVDARANEEMVAVTFRFPVDAGAVVSVDIDGATYTRTLTTSFIARSTLIVERAAGEDEKSVDEILENDRRYAEAKRVDEAFLSALRDEDDDA